MTETHIEREREEKEKKERFLKKDTHTKKKWRKKGREYADVKMTG